MLHRFFFFISYCVLSLLSVCSNADTRWQVETFTFPSKHLAQAKLNIEPQREVYVWLPPSYKTSKKNYPVIYYIHNYGWSARQMQEIERIGDSFERALKRGHTGEFIFVVGDMRVTDFPGTFCGNNPIVGHWWDYLVDELVPAVDKRYRSIARYESRGLTGDFIGGYCAIRTAMERPGTFASLYALHPVGTGVGTGNMLDIPNWELLNTAADINDIDASDGFTRAFLLMAQSHTPNKNKPPFYADFMMEMRDGKLAINTDTVTRLRNNFLLSHRVPHTVDALKKLKAFMFDWGRNDGVRDHVFGNQQFTRLLANYGIDHAAEEHEGNQWDNKWTPYGRVETRVLPFFQRYLLAEP